MTPRQCDIAATAKQLPMIACMNNAANICYDEERWEVFSIMMKVSITCREESTRYPIVLKR